VKLTSTSGKENDTGRPQSETENLRARKPCRFYHAIEYDRSREKEKHKMKLVAVKMKPNGRVDVQGKGESKTRVKKVIT